MEREGNRRPPRASIMRMTNLPTQVRCGANVVLAAVVALGLLDHKPMNSVYGGGMIRSIKAVNRTSYDAQKTFCQASRRVQAAQPGRSRKTTDICQCDLLISSRKRSNLTSGLSTLSRRARQKVPLVQNIGLSGIFLIMPV